MNRPFIASLVLILAACTVGIAAQHITEHPPHVAPPAAEATAPPPLAAVGGDSDIAATGPGPGLDSPHVVGGSAMTWQERLDRIRELRPAADPLGPVVRCVRCRDSGVIEFTGGTVTSYRGLKVEASEARPVYRRCSCVDKEEE